MVLRPRSLLLALSLAPMTSQASAQTEAEVEALTELRQTLPALEWEELAREMRENLQRNEQARKSDGIAPIRVATTRLPFYGFQMTVTRTQA